MSSVSGRYGGSRVLFICWLAFPILALADVAMNGPNFHDFFHVSPGHSYWLLHQDA